MVYYFVGCSVSKCAPFRPDLVRVLRVILSFVWLADRLDLHRIDGEVARRFEFLDADAVYASDAAGNVIEWLCDDDRGAGGGDPAAAAFDGVTEVGLPAPEPLALVKWLTESVGLSAWASPSESFAWVGDRTARFVVLPVGGEWYPTDRETGIESMGVRVVDGDATPGTYRHPELPYEITVPDQ